MNRMTAMIPRAHLKVLLLGLVLGAATAAGCGATNDIVAGPRAPSSDATAAAARSGSSATATTGGGTTTTPTGTTPPATAGSAPGTGIAPRPGGASVPTTGTIASRPPTTCVSASATTTDVDKEGGRLVCTPPPTAPPTAPPTGPGPGNAPATKPDGSPVTTTTFAPDADRGVVQGTLVAGPTCPVERPDQPCAPRQIGGTVTFRSVRLASGREPASAVVREVTAGESFGGLFAPGEWEVSARSPSAMSCPTSTVTVVAGAVQTISIACDTGIR